jgi:hypothetical protein
MKIDYQAQPTPPLVIYITVTEAKNILHELLHLKTTTVQGMNHYAELTSLYNNLDKFLK